MGGLSSQLQLTPNPLIRRPTRNMALSTDPAQIAAPTTRITAAAWIVCFRENLSAQYAHAGAPIADPAEFTPVSSTVRDSFSSYRGFSLIPLKAPIYSAVRPYPG